MNLGYIRGNRLTQQLNILEDFPVDELFSDGQQEFEELLDPESELTALLDYAEAGDQVVIASLDVISRDYEELKKFLFQLDHQRLSLYVSDLPELTNEEWLAFLKWVQRNERIVHPRLMKVGKEKQRNTNYYTLTTQDPEAKKLYREIIWSVVARKTLRQIAKEKRVPIETVFRIKKEVEKFQLAAVLVVCFLLAIFSIKITEMYFDSLWLQVGICVLVTLIILWNVLADLSKETR